VVPRSLDYFKATPRDGGPILPRAPLAGRDSPSTSRRSAKQKTIKTPHTYALGSISGGEPLKWISRPAISSIPVRIGGGNLEADGQVAGANVAGVCTWGSTVPGKSFFPGMGEPQQAGPHKDAEAADASVSFRSRATTSAGWQLSSVEAGNAPVAADQCAPDNAIAAFTWDQIAGQKRRVYSSSPKGITRRCNTSGSGGAQGPTRYTSGQGRWRRG